MVNFKPPVKPPAHIQYTRRCLRSTHWYDSSIRSTYHTLAEVMEEFERWLSLPKSHPSWTDSLSVGLLGEEIDDEGNANEEGTKNILQSRSPQLGEEVDDEGNANEEGTEDTLQSRPPQLPRHFCVILLWLPAWHLQAGSLTASIDFSGTSPRLSTILRNYDGALFDLEHQKKWMLQDIKKVVDAVVYCGEDFYDPEKLLLTPTLGERQ
jgi:hypothetical protein